VRRTVTSVHRAEFARRYLAGESLREIAAQTGWGHITVRNGLQRERVQLRRRGPGARKGSLRPLPDPAAPEPIS